MQKLSQGFTLVELLIVVIILAIIAAVVFPQFSSRTSDAKDAAYQSNLTNLQSAIERYNQEHDGVYPGANLAAGATCGSGVDIAPGGPNTEAALVAQLTAYTNVGGRACTGKDATHKYGPYIKGSIPNNPKGTNNSVTVINAGVLGLTSATTGGWRYDTITGEIIGDH